MPARNPFDEIERMLERMDRQFRGIEEGDHLSGSVSVDVEDRGDEFVVTADLPGFDTDDIDVELEDNVLHVRGEHTTEHEESEEGEFIRQERHRQSVSRSVRLPEPVDEEATDANYRNGVLTVTLPKREGGGGVDIDVS